MNFYKYTDLKYGQCHLFLIIFINYMISKFSRKTGHSNRNVYVPVYVLQNYRVCTFINNTRYTKHGVSCIHDHSPIFELW